MAKNLLYLGAGIYCVYIYFEYKQQLEEDSRGLYIRRNNSHSYPSDAMKENYKRINYTESLSKMKFQYEDKYLLDPKAMKEIVEASHHVHSLCLEVVDQVTKSEELMDLFDIPPFMRPIIKDTWKKNEADILNKMLFLYDGQNPPKFYEYAADPYKGLYETARCQAMWGSMNYKLDLQFNYIKNALNWVFEEIMLKSPKTMYFVRGNTDFSNELNLLTDVAKYKAHDIRTIPIGDLKYSPETKTLGYKEYSLSESLKEVEWVYSCIPWYQIGPDAIGEFISYGSKTAKVIFKEPPWKLILESRALLPYLWARFPNDPYLLPAYFTNKQGEQGFTLFNSLPENAETKWVAVPMFGRRSNWLLESSKYETSALFFDDAATHFAGNGRRIIQKLYPTPTHRDRRIKLAMWMIYGAPVGLGIQEETSLNTDVITVHEVNRFRSPPDEIKRNDFDFRFPTENSKKISQKIYGNMSIKLKSELYNTKNEYLGEIFKTRIDPVPQQNQSSQGSYTSTTNSSTFSSNQNNSSYNQNVNHESKKSNINESRQIRKKVDYSDQSDDDDGDNGGGRTKEHTRKTFAEKLAEKKAKSKDD